MTLSDLSLNTLLFEHWLHSSAPGSVVSVSPGLDALLPTGLEGPWLSVSSLGTCLQTVSKCFSNACELPKWRVALGLSLQGVIVRTQTLLSMFCKFLQKCHWPPFFSLNDHMQLSLNPVHWLVNLTHALYSLTLIGSLLSTICKHERSHEVFMRCSQIS